VPRNEERTFSTTFLGFGGRNLEGKGEHEVAEIAEEVSE